MPLEYTTIDIISIIWYFVISKSTRTRVYGKCSGWNTSPTWASLIGCSFYFLFDFFIDLAYTIYVRQIMKEISGKIALYEFDDSVFFFLS